MSSSVVDKNPNLVERKLAAKMLNISTRTLDRYLRKKKLSSTKKNHRIYLKRNEIDAFINEYKVDNVDYDQNVSVDFNEKRFSSEKEQDIPNDTVNQMLSKVDGNQGMTFLKGLYMEMKKDIEVKNEKIQVANYKIGKLESELKQSIPLIDHNKQEQVHEKEKQQLAKRVSDLSDEKGTLEKELKTEKWNRYVSLSLLAFLLLAVPTLVYLSVYGII